jgi:HlyD family secretion protein
MRTLFVILALLAVVGGGATYFADHWKSAPVVRFRTTEVERGDLLLTIEATGTVEPEEVVDVGAQVAGLIQEFGTDPHDPNKLIDYGTAVEQGTVLAKIDPTPYEAALDQAEATLERSQADLQQLEAKCEQAKQDWKRAESLRPKGAIAGTEYDTAVANYKVAEANIAVGKATIRQNEAALQVAKTNLGYTTIKSPVEGVIIDRRVNIGQTVVASLNAPSLFLIAKDLRRMEVWASVNEVDIGAIRPGMPVTFTVDAFPDRTFHGEVSQIRLNAAMTQNVVTYTVVVSTDNSDGTLLPYLTANVQFDVEQRSGVLLVPNAALRWSPAASQVDPSVGQGASSDEPGGSPNQGMLWTTTDRGLARPVPVTLGASDKTQTEVSGSGLAEGMPVIIGEADASAQQDGEATSGDETRNPFLPKLPRHRPPPRPM